MSDNKNHAFTRRILYLVPEAIPTFRADVAVMFGKYLPRHEIGCDLVGMPGKGELREQGFVSVHRPENKGGRMRHELAYLWLCLRRLLAANQRNCQLIQVRDMVGIGVLGLIFARIKGIPYAYWMSFLMNEGRIGRARAEIAKGGGLRYRLVLLKGLIETWLLDKWILPKADHVFVQSEEMKRVVMAKNIPAAKLTPVPMGVDGETLRPQEIQAQRLPGWEGVPLVAYLGTLDRSRQFDVVINAVHSLRRDVPGVRLLLIGDSPTKSDLDDYRRQAQELGMADALHITGWMDSKQAWPLLAGADLAISYFPRGPLFDSTSPTKSLEYLALAMPCVGNDTPDQAYILSNSDAGWLTASNAEAMAQAMREIFADLPAARARAARGPAFIDKERSYRVLSAQLAQVYRRLF